MVGEEEKGGELAVGAEREEKKEEWRGARYFSTWPSRRSTVLICDLRSGSCVAGEYVFAALGTRTGVVGWELMVGALVAGRYFQCC